MSARKPIITTYSIPLDDNKFGNEFSIEVVRVGEYRGDKFDLTADVWAIRYLGRCLGRDGTWEYEPLPSNRTDEFKARTRWGRVRAITAAIEVADDGNYPGGKAFRMRTQTVESETEA